MCVDRHVSSVSREQTLDTVTARGSLSTGSVASGFGVLMSCVMPPVSGKESGVDVTHK